MPIYDKKYLHKIIKVSLELIIIPCFRLEHEYKRCEKFVTLYL